MTSAKNPTNFSGGSVKNNWLYLIAGALIFITLVLLIITGNFSGWTFFGAVFYVLLTIGGYVYIMLGKNIENMKNSEEQTRKRKFDWCWERVNVILRRMTNGEGLQWSGGAGRESQYRVEYDGVQNRPLRSMSGYLERTQKLVVVIYDINNDDILRFDSNPSPEVIENHFHKFRLSTRGYTNPYQNTDSSQIPFGLHSRRTPVQVNIGGEDQDNQSYQLPKPDDDMIDSALEKLG